LLNTFGNDILDYSITSSAVISNDWGIVIPRALAILELITKARGLLDRQISGLCAF
jgi:hypothetical protein